MPSSHFDYGGHLHELLSIFRGIKVRVIPPVTVMRTVRIRVYWNGNPVRGICNHHRRYDFGDEQTASD